MALIAIAAVVGTIGAGRSTPDDAWNNWYTAAAALGGIGLVLVLIPVAGLPKVSRFIVARDWWTYLRAKSAPLWRAGYHLYGHALLLSLNSDRDPLTNEPPVARHIRVEVRTPVGSYYYDKSPSRPWADGQVPPMSQFSKSFPELFHPDEGAPRLDRRSSLPRGRYFVYWYEWRDEGTSRPKRLLDKDRFKLKKGNA